MFHRVACEDVHAHASKTAGHGILPQVGTADGIPQVVQHLGDAAHAGTTDTHEVHVPHPAHALWLRGCRRMQCRTHTAVPAPTV